jgi:PIN domain nuclease of toxin-antitoxin system
MRGVLLDTHTILWMVSDETRIGPLAREILFDSDTPKLMSPASYWELAIKIKIGKLELASDYEEFIQDVIDMYAVTILHVHPHHTSVLTTLELHHGDPFDRLMIAQALVEEIPILSSDKQFDSYPVNRIWKYRDEDIEPNAEEER